MNDLQNQSTLTAEEEKLNVALANMKRLSAVLAQSVTDGLYEKAIPLRSTSTGRHFALMETGDDYLLFCVEPRELTSAEVKLRDLLKNPVSFAKLGLYEALDDCLHGNTWPWFVNDFLEEVLSGVDKYRGMRVCVASGALIHHLK